MMNNELLTQNFYQLFDMPIAFEIDIDHLQQQFRMLAQSVHPDKFASAGDQARRISMQQTSWVNKAYQTLKDPIERASYLLQLKGIDVNLENETTMDAAFLMEQMELRETLEAVRLQSDPLAALDNELKNVKNNMQAMSQAFSTAYQANRLDDAKECLRKMQFIQKARNEIDSMTAKIEDELF
jgi:molecular chaperone HscB